MRIQNTVIISVYGGVVQDIATDLDPEGVRFILIDSGKGEVEVHGDVYPSKLTDPFSREHLRALGADECLTDEDAITRHGTEHGVSGCQSPQLWRRQVTDDLDDDPAHDLRIAARQVVDRWEGGDLAGAVQYLAACLGD